MVDDVYLQAIGLRTLALIEKEKGKYGIAETMLFQAKDMFEKIGDNHFLAVTIGSIGSLKRDQNKVDEAEYYFTTAISIAKKMNNPEEILTIFYQKIAKLFIIMGKLDEAEIYTRKALNILHLLKRPIGYAYCKIALALIAEKRGDIKDAHHYACEAEELFSTFGAKEDITADIKRLGNYSESSRETLSEDGSKGKTDMP